MPTTHSHVRSDMPMPQYTMGGLGPLSSPVVSSSSEVFLEAQGQPSSREILEERDATLSASIQQMDIHHVSS